MDEAALPESLIGVAGFSPSGLTLVPEMFLLGMSVIFEINRDIPYQVALSFDEIAMEVLAWLDGRFRDRGFERISKLTRGRQAALDYAQAPECFAAIRQRQGIAARALEVTLLTGLRTGEVIGARWTEIDLERKTWVIPPERLKDRKNRTEPHRVRLSPQVAAMGRDPAERTAPDLFPTATASALPAQKASTQSEPRRYVLPKNLRSAVKHLTTASWT